MKGGFFVSIPVENYHVYLNSWTPIRGQINYNLFRVFIVPEESLNLTKI